MPIIDFESEQRNFRQESGMTLIEVMAAAAVAATITLVISKGLVATNRAAKGVSLKSNWESLLSVIRYTTNTPGFSGSNTANSCYSLLQHSFQQSGIPFPSGGPTPIPSPTFSPIALTVLGTPQNTFLQTKTSLNGIYAHSIVLKEVPGYSTTPASGSTYSDYVYFEIQAKRVMSPSDASMSVNPDLFSGWPTGTGTNTPAAIDPIAFTLYKDASGAILGCDGSNTLGMAFQCKDLDPNATYSNPLASGHALHSPYEPNCQLTTLTLNATQTPSQPPGIGTPSVAQIVFGDWDEPGRTTLNSPPPDTIVDSIQDTTMNINSQTLLMNPSGLINPAGGPVSIGTTSTASGFLSVGGTISQLAAPGSLSSYLQTNALSLYSKTLLTPGILVYQNVSNPHYFGLDRGFNPTTSRYRTRVFAPKDKEIAFSFHPINTTPIAQTSFTDAMVIVGSTGNVGIGTPTPAALLDVEGPTAVTTTKITPLPSNSLTVNGNGLIEASCSVNACPSSNQGNIKLGNVTAYTCSCTTGYLVSGGAYCSGTNNNPGIALSLSSQSLPSPPGTPGMWIALCNPTSQSLTGGQPDVVFATCCTVSGNAALGGPSSVSLQNPTLPSTTNNNGNGCSNPTLQTCVTWNSATCYAANSVVTRNGATLVCINASGCQFAGWTASNATCGGGTGGTCPTGSCNYNNCNGIASNGTCESTYVCVNSQSFCECGASSTWLGPMQCSPGTSCNPAYNNATVSKTSPCQ